MLILLMKFLLQNNYRINTVATVIKNGNLPLHGTNAFVNIAINLSLGESIILHPTTPAALHPNPMHMVVTRWWFWKVLINVAF